MNIGDGSSRTTLKWNGEQGSDYINASFIDVKLTTNNLCTTVVYTLYHRIGIQTEEGLHCHSGTTRVNCQRLLEDGLGAEIVLCCHAMPARGIQ